MKKLISTALFFSFFSLLVASPFNKNLKEDEFKSLSNGETVVKSIGYAKNMSLSADYSDDAKELVKAIKDLSPKYLAEIILVKPYKGNEDILEKLNSSLNDVKSYIGIPYWSVRHECYFDLYSDAEVLSRQGEATDSNQKLSVMLNMAPFGEIYEDIEVTRTDSALLYKTVNTSKVKVNNQFDCFGPGKMKMILYAFRDGDNWILYGIGGVNAPHLPFLTQRIEVSFINRIKTFCSFIFNKL